MLITDNKTSTEGECKQQGNCRITHGMLFRVNRHGLVFLLIKSTIQKPTRASNRFLLLVSSHHMNIWHISKSANVRMRQVNKWNSSQ